MTCWLLSVHYAEQDVGPVKVNDPCSCERKEWDHVCETVRFSLRRVDCDGVLQAFDCELKCGCGTGPCCEEHHTSVEHKHEHGHDTTQPRREISADEKHGQSEPA